MKEIAQRIGEDICLGIPFFYAFSGCDVTSSFYGISKNKWWEMWSKNEKLNKTFIDLSWTPICVTDAVFTEIEQMVSSMYCASHSFTSLSELRYELFKSSTSNDLRKIPPSTDALQLPVLRSSYVTGWVWGGALEDPSSIPSPSDWGWTVNSGGKLVPKWTSDSDLDIEQHCLFTCKCKSECKRCRCANEQARCLPFCKCGCNVKLYINIYTLVHLCID